MCFNASASFVASGGLAVMGVATYRVATKKQKVLALIPILFALQQLFEGFQWVCVKNGSPSLILGYLFLFFAFLLWPVFIPSTVFYFDQQRKTLLKGLIGIGIGVSSVLLGYLVASPLSIFSSGDRLVYQIGNLSSPLLAMLYLTAVCGSLVASSKREFQLFGSLIFFSAMASAYYYFNSWVSVWCFFSALLSSLIYFYVSYGSRQRKNV